MRKLSIRLMLPLVSLAMTLSMAFGIGKSRNQAIEATAVGSYSTSASTYYNGITASSGKQLAAQLHDLITSTHKTYTSYADNGGNGYQKDTDRYYENGNPVSGYIYEFYSGVKWPDGWDPNAGKTTGGYNREHCWCQSNSVNAAGKQMWGETGGGADMHHLRPVESRLNSTRGNNEYGEISNRDSYKVYAKYGENTTYALGGYNNGGTFEPLDSKKGDVARIILYTYLHYNSYTISDLFGSYGTTNGSGSSSFFSTSLLSLTKITNQNTEAKALEMLLSWNTSDPVDDIERRRNEQVAVYQGNRNPFIDDSSYADAIWGNGSSSTPAVNSVSLSATTLNLDVNGTDTAQLTATVNVTGEIATTVNWTSSNTNVATVDSSGNVTAKAKGSCTITATSTVNSNKSASCSVKVSDSSGGSVPVTGNFSWNLAIASYDANPSASQVTWSHDYATMESIRTDSKKTPANNWIGGANNRTSTKFYTGNPLRITPASDVTITSAVFTATSESFANVLGSNTTWTNASASASDTTVTVTPTDRSAAFSGVPNAQCGFTSVTVNYSTTTSGSSSALSSITLNTSNVQTEFYKGDTFDYSGLIVTAHYEDGTEDTVTPSSVSSPIMSTTGQKTITVTYTENSVTKTATYTINVVNLDITGIYANVVDDPLFHPGDTISASDLHVEDNLGNEIDDFVFNGGDDYLVTYDDAPSGGNETTATLSGIVTYDTYSCDLEIHVSRVAYVTPNLKTDTMNKVWTGVTETKYTAWTGKTSSSGATYAGQSASGNNYIQLRSANPSGIVTTAYSGSAYISSVSVTWDSSTDATRVLQIYGKASAYTEPAQLYSDSTKGTLIGSFTKGSTTSATLPLSSQYQYIGIRSASGALYLTEIVVTYGTNETAENVANYIMYEDTQGQCTGKLDSAITKLNSMSTAEKSAFMDQEAGYVIASARERISAWAIHEGKTFSYSNSNDEFTAQSLSKSIALPMSRKVNSMFYIALLSFAGLSAIAGYFFLRKRKER